MLNVLLRVYARHQIIGFVAWVSDANRQLLRFNLVPLLALDGSLGLRAFRFIPPHLLQRSKSLVLHLLPDHALEVYTCNLSPLAAVEFGWIFVVGPSGI